MPLMKRIGLLCLASYTILVNAQPLKKFYTKFGGGGYDIGYDVKQTLDKGYIVTGSTSSFGQGNTDLYLVKLDSMGQKKFETSFGGAINEIGRSIVQLADSSFVVAGYTSSLGFGGYDFFLVKADKRGHLLWQKTIGGSEWDFAYSLQQTSDGGFIIAGTTYSYGRGNADGYVVKTDAEGNVQWSKTYGGQYDDEFKSVIQTTDGGYALCGYTKSYNDVLYGDAWLFKLNNMGDSLKSFSYNFGLADAFNDIKELASGDYITAGYVTFNNHQKRDGIFNKISSNGSILERTTEGQAGTDEEYYKVGISNSSFGVYTVLGNSHENAPAYKTDVKFLLLNSGGWYVNGGAIGSLSDEECFGFCLTNERSKGYVAVGYTKGYNSVLSDCFLIKYDSLLAIGDMVVGVEEMNDSPKQLSVYPNPYTETLNLKLTHSIIETIEVFSIYGDLVYSIKSPRIENELNLGFLKNGTYIINVADTHKNKYIQKIVKSNIE